MMFSRRLAATLAAAAMTTATAAGAMIPAQAAVMHDMELHATLHGSDAHPRATGTASFESGDHGRELDVQVSRIPGLAGSRLVIFVHGVRAGTMTVSGAGSAHLDRHGGVPACRSGQAIRVRTGSGTLVGSGIFRPHHHD